MNARCVPWQALAPRVAESLAPNRFLVAGHGFDLDALRAAGDAGQRAFIAGEPVRIHMDLRLLIGLPLLAVVALVAALIVENVVKLNILSGLDVPTARPGSCWNWSAWRTAPAAGRTR